MNTDTIDKFLQSILEVSEFLKSKGRKESAIRVLRTGSVIAQQLIEIQKLDRKDSYEWI